MDRRAGVDCQRHLRLFIVCLCMLTHFPAHASKQAAEIELNIAYSGYAGQQRDAFVSVAHEFQRRNHHISINFKTQKDEDFKANLEQWLAREKYLDAVIWHAGERLFKHVRRGQVSPLTDLWREENLEGQFSPAMQQLVRYREEFYAVPITYYQWGFYYKKSNFARNNVEAPRNWEEFTRVLGTLKRRGQTPLSLGSASVWPIAAWFEFLNLNINGIAYHRRFADGDPTLSDEGIRKVLVKWKTLIDQGFFDTRHGRMNWQDTLPDIYRETAGMTLLGNFVESIIPPAIVDDIGFFPFPRTDESVGNYQPAPTDVIFIPANSRHKEAAKMLVAFFAEPKNQAHFNDLYNQLPPNMNAKGKQSELSRCGKDVLENAEGFTQYFDRDAEDQFSKDMMNIWVRFVDRPDIEATIGAMNQARYRLFIRKQSG